MRKLFLLLFVVCLKGLLLAQSTAESPIQTLLKKAIEQADVDINQALYFANSALQIAENEHNTFMIYESYRKLGAIYGRQQPSSRGKGFLCQSANIE